MTPQEQKAFGWPLRPATTAYVLEGLALALADLIEQEPGSNLADRRLHKQLAGLGTATRRAPRR